MYEIVYIYRKRLIFNLLGGGSRIRTGDPMLAKHVLYQLSYTPLLLSGCKDINNFRIPQYLRV